MTSVIRDDAYKILNKEIERRGLKKTFVAKKLDISPQYLSPILNGKLRISGSFAIRASHVFKIPLSALLDKKELDNMGTF